MKASRSGKAAALTLLAGLVLLGLLSAATLAGEDEAEEIAQGKALYEAHCVICHGEKGDGKGPAGPGVGAADFTGGFKTADNEDDIERIILEGIPGTAMTGFAGRISEEEAESLAEYIQTFVKKK